MYNSRGKWFLAVLFLLLGNSIYAQTLGSSNPNSERENNPYSKYGVGELWNGNTTALKGMGNITSAFSDPFIINSDNPASYTSLILTTFDGGGIASSRNITNASGASYNTGTASLGYINLGVPLGKKAGMALGLRPYTKCYYALADTVATPLGGTVRSYAGDGGLSYAYLGGAYKFKGLSIGFNFGYMFGNYRKFTTVADTFNPHRDYQSQFARYIRLGGINWKGGATYEVKSRDSNYTFRVGGTLTLGQNLNETVSYYKSSSYDLGGTLINDTVKADSYTDRKGKLKLPTSFSIGVLLSKTDKWAWGFDYSAINWTNFSS
ncbi:MAG: hypothetical protein H7257_06295, partial [Taibaiella sp.]|nr:hypothetical protein [Taibaiella sp.]